MKMNEAGTSVQNKYESFLTGKPMWVSWIAYSVLCGILFGIFYAAMSFLSMQWWIPIIIIIAVGMIWGTLEYKGTKKVLI